MVKKKHFDESSNHSSKIGCKRKLNENHSQNHIKKCRIDKKPDINNIKSIEELTRHAIKFYQEKKTCSHLYQSEFIFT